MALNFPSNPSTNDTYTYNDRTWVYTGRYWEIQGTGAINNIPIGNTGPSTGNFTTVGATGNITSDQYFIGNGAFLTGISGGAGNYSNANVAAYLPTYTGNLSAGNIAVTSNVTTDNLNVGTLLDVKDIALTGQILSNLNVSGNVQAQYILGNGSQLTGILYSSLVGAYGNANVKNYLGQFDGNIVPSADAIYDLGSNTNQWRSLWVSNNTIYLNRVPINVSNGNTLLVNGMPLVAANGNSNINTTGTVTALTVEVGTVNAANIIANYIAGDGSNIFNLNYSNANVAAYLPTYTGALTSLTGNVTTTANISAAYVLGNGAFLTGISASNIVGSYGNSQVAAYLQVYDGNALFGNVTVSQDTVILGNLRVQGNTTYLNVTDLNIEDKNIIVAANATATMTDLNGAGLQIGNRTAGGNITFFYNSSSNIMQLSHGLSVANGITTPGTILGRTVQALGDITAIGSNIVAGQYVIGDGSQLTGILYSSLVGAYGNSNVAAYLPTYTGNLTAGNIAVTNNISFNGNLSLSNTGNIIGTSENTEIVTNSYTWTFDDLGNLTTPGNVAAGNAVSANFYLGNIRFTTGGYNNANVAAYLPTYQGNIGNITFLSNSSAAAALIVYDRALTMGGANLAYATLPDDGNANTVAAEFTNHGLGNVIISSGPADWEWTFTNTGNLSAPGNITAGNAISANYFLGNGALLTGIVAGSNYGNANVANYLPTYTGALPALAGNVITSANVSGAYILGNGAFLTGLPAQYSNANVANYLPTYTGNLASSSDIVALYANAATQAAAIASLQNLQYSNANVAAYLPTYTGNLTAGNVAVTNNISFNGNLSLGNAGNIIGTSQDTQIVTNNYTWIFDDIGNLTAPGDIIANNLYAINNLNAALLTGDGSGIFNLNLAGLDQDISTTGNVTANYYTGNIRNTTGGYNNANVAAYLSIYNGNGLFGNLTVTDDVVVTGNFRVDGNTTYINANALTVNDKDIIVANNAAQLSDLDDAGLQIGNLASGNVQFFYDAAGNIMTLSHGLTLANNLSVTGNIIGPAGNMQISAGNVRLVAGSRTFVFDNSGNITGSNNITANYYYGDISNTTGGYSNTNVASYLNSGSFVPIVTTGAVQTGNISAPYYFGNGYFLTGIAGGGAGNYSNANVLSYLQAFPGNIIPQSNGAYNLGNNNTRWGDVYVNGSLYLPFQSITANGTQIFASANIAANGFIGSGSQLTNVAAAGSNTEIQFNNNGILGSDSRFLYDAAGFDNIGALWVSGGIILADQIEACASISTGTLSAFGNIVTGANISGEYILGNGAFLTGIAGGGGSNYSNANVAAYLPTYTGNLSAGNISTTGSLSAGNVVITGNLQVLGNTTTINANTLTINDKDIIVANNATNISSLNGAGLQIGNLASGNIQFFYNSASNLMTLSRGLSVSNGIVTSGNVTAAGAEVLGNITAVGSSVIADYFVGNGALLTGGYSNTNVAAYLPTYTGNLASLTGNVTTTANVNSAGITTTNISAAAIVATGNITGTNIIGNVAAGNVNGLAIGYRDIPQVSWTGTVTLALSDAGRHYYTAAGGVTLNIPTNAAVPFAIGTAITLVNQSTANCTIARGSTTLYLAGNATSADRILSSYGFATMVKVDTDTWFINGGNVI